MNIFTHRSSRRLLAALLPLMLIACGGHDTVQEPEDEAGCISFGGTVTKTKAGAGDVITDTKDKLTKSPFGVYGFKTSSDNASVNSNFSNVFVSPAAQEVGWDAEKSVWTYSPKRRWEQSMHYRFRAFWPYDVELNPKSNANRIGIEYKTTTSQYDLLVAYATRHPLKDGTGSVTMTFRHALSGLRFKVRFADGVEAGVKDAVTEFYLKGLFSVGYLIYGQLEDADDENKINWEFDRNGNTFDSTSKLFDWTGSREFRSGDTTGATVFDNGQVVLVPPQTLSSSEGRITTANFLTTLGGDAVHAVKLPETTLEPGKIYTFTLVIHETKMTVDIDIKDWDVIKSNVDINL